MGPTKTSCVRTPKRRLAFAFCLSSGSDSGSFPASGSCCCCCYSCLAGPAVAAAAGGPVASSLPLLVRFNNVNNLILCLNGAPPFVCKTWGIQKQNKHVYVCVGVCVHVYACISMFLREVNAIFEARQDGLAMIFTASFPFYHATHTKLQLLTAFCCHCHAPYPPLQSAVPLFWGHTAKCFK